MSLIAMLITIAGHQVIGQSTEVSLATSEAIDIARSAAISWDREQYSKYHSTFDIVDPAIDQLPGYKSVIYYSNGRPVLDVSINLSTGQVVDRDRCVYFDSHFFRMLRNQFSSATGVPPLHIPTLATKLGCDALKNR